MRTHRGIEEKRIIEKTNKKKDRRKKTMIE
jgi:hypothetical protein